MAIHDIKSLFKSITSSGRREMRNLDDQPLIVGLLLDSYRFDHEIGCPYRRVDAIDCNRVDCPAQQFMVLLVADIPYAGAQYYLKIDSTVIRRAVSYTHLRAHETVLD